MGNGFVCMGSITIGVDRTAVDDADDVDVDGWTSLSHSLTLIEMWSSDVSVAVAAAAASMC